MRSRRRAPRDGAAQNGTSCTLIDFEGLGDLASIPSFQGISLPNWLSIIEEAADGSGNFSYEPSPVTVAFWLGDDTSETIEIPNGASSISFYYSSYYPVTVYAYDKEGNLVDTAYGDANFDEDNATYDYWDPLQVNASKTAPITSITVVGYADYTGIDDLNVCQVTNIDAVEITQAIQQYQTLSDLKASLTATGEPPVPIVSGKPAVMRVYFQEVQDVTNVTVQLSGVASETKSMTLLPHCTDDDQRSGDFGCQSMDFYFTPPSGTWTATLDTLDDTGKVLTEQVLTVKSRDTNGIRLRAVSICDAKDAAGTWLCANASDLLGKTTLLGKIAPTNVVTVDVTKNVVREDVATFANVDAWWDAAIADVNAYYGLFDTGVDYLVGWYTTYFGEIRPGLAGGTGGMAHDIPSHGAGARTSVTRLGTETNVEVVAHETGHTLGLRHTNTDVPVAGGAPPGCYNKAQDGATNWPFANNYIQSTARLEYGFDVADRKIIDPNVTYDVMSYCVPRWISPQRYKTLINTLGGGAVTTPSTGATPADVTGEPQPRTGGVQTSGTAAKFWQVRGTIQNFTVQFSPLFQVTIVGDTGQGSGTYSLLELNATSQVLFSRLFTPQASQTETSGAQVTGTLGFAQAIPVMTGAAAIVVKDASSLEIGRITLSGSAPVVAVTAPAAGSTQQGVQNVTWTIQNLNGANSTSKVLYSVDSGSTWSGLGDVKNATSLPVNFDALAGATTAMIQVLVSDGVNTGSATSGIFTVPKKAPTVAIQTPKAGAGQPAADPVYLTGTAYDPEDGMLSGSALVWTSNLQGQLGTGSPLTVHLNPGSHTITLKATDSNANAVSTSVAMTVGGQAPAVGIQATAIDTAPTTCESVTVTAQAGQGGAPLASVQVSLDGGLNYQALALSAVPFTFYAPGSGFLHFVARAYDTSGQSNAKDVTFLTQSVCKKVACNVNQDLNTDIADVQTLLREALGKQTAADDLNNDGKVTLVEIQTVITAAMGKGCAGN